MGLGYIQNEIGGRRLKKVLLLQSTIHCGKKNEMISKWDLEENLAYTAGFLDGEGCFYSMPNKYCKVIVTATNSCKRTIEWLHETYGGNIFKEPKRKSHHKQLYRWTVVGNVASRLCQKISPYLKEKAEQALLIITIQQTKRRGPLPDDVINERKRLLQKLKELKHG